MEAYEFWVSGAVVTLVLAGYCLSLFLASATLPKFPGATRMRRMTISMDDDLADLFDAFMKKKGYESRSEAIRDLLRA